MGADIAKSKVFEVQIACDDGKLRPSSCVSRLRSQAASTSLDPVQWWYAGGVAATVYQGFPPFFAYGLETKPTACDISWLANRGKNDSRCHFISSRVVFSLVLGALRLSQYS